MAMRSWRDCASRVCAATISALPTTPPSKRRRACAICSSARVSALFESAIPAIAARTFAAARRSSNSICLCKSGADAETVRRRLQTSLPADVLLLTRAELLHREECYWAENTPIGFVFRLGLIVGSLLVYQILHDDVSDHLAEYAALKAIGYTNRRWLALRGTPNKPICTF
jgi:hypothetical protein